MAHYPHWFLPKFKLWISDSPVAGRLVLVRYNGNRGSIDGYQVVATNQTPGHYASPPEKGFTTIRRNDPAVSLRVARPTFYIPAQDEPASREGSNADVNADAGPGTNKSSAIISKPRGRKPRKPFTAKLRIPTAISSVQMYFVLARAVTETETETDGTPAFDFL